MENDNRLCPQCYHDFNIESDKYVKHHKMV